MRRCSSPSASWWASLSSCCSSSSRAGVCGSADAFDTGWFLRLCQWAAPLGFIAVIAGWTTTEVGRQPWTVYGLLRTADSVSPSLTGRDVAISLALYMVVYLLMFPTGIAFMARHRAARAAGRAAEPAAIESGRPDLPSKLRWPRRSDPERARLSDGHRSRSDLDRYSGARACSITSCSTASISASACCTASRPTTPTRDLVMNSIAPVWDGNETWLVLGGLGLLAAFPLAFAIIIPAVYFPILIMLLALVFRGVAFEFRFKRRRLRTLLGPRLLRRIGGRDVRAGRGARRLHPGLQGRWPTFRRHLVRLADAVLAR